MIPDLSYDQEGGRKKEDNIWNEHNKCTSGDVYLVNRNHVT